MNTSMLLILYWSKNHGNLCAVEKEKEKEKQTNQQKRTPNCQWKQTNKDTEKQFLSVIQERTLAVTLTFLHHQFSHYYFWNMYTVRRTCMLFHGASNQIYWLYCLRPVRVFRIHAFLCFCLILQYMWLIEWFYLTPETMAVVTSTLPKWLTVISFLVTWRLCVTVVSGCSRLSDHILQAVYISWFWWATKCWPWRIVEMPVWLSVFVSFLCAGERPSSKLNNTKFS